MRLGRGTAGRSIKLHLFDTADKNSRLVSRSISCRRFETPRSPRASPLHRSPRKNLPPSSPLARHFSRARPQRTAAEPLPPAPPPPWLPRTRRRAARRPLGRACARDPPRSPTFPAPPPPRGARARLGRFSVPGHHRPALFSPTTASRPSGTPRAARRALAACARDAPPRASRAGSVPSARRPREREGGTARPPPHPADARFLSCRSPPPPNRCPSSIIGSAPPYARRSDRSPGISVQSSSAFSSSRVLLFFPPLSPLACLFSHPPLLFLSTGPLLPQPPPPPHTNTQTHKHTNEQVTPEQRAAAAEHKALGNKEFVAGQFDAAAKHFTAAIEQDPTDPSSTPTVPRVTPASASSSPRWRTPSGASSSSPSGARATAAWVWLCSRRATSPAPKKHRRRFGVRPQQRHVQRRLGRGSRGEAAYGGERRARGEGHGEPRGDGPERPLRRRHRSRHDVLVRFGLEGRRGAGAGQLGGGTGRRRRGSPSPTTGVWSATRPSARRRRTRSGRCSTSSASSGGSSRSARRRSRSCPSTSRRASTASR